MTAIDELADLVRTTSEAAAPAVVGIGRRGRGTGFVVAPGQGAHERPQPARPDRRRCTSPTVGPCRRRSPAATSTVISSCSTSTPATSRRFRGPTTPSNLGRRRHRRDGRAPPPACGVGSGHGDGGGVPWPAWPADRRGHRAHRAVCGGIVGRAGARPGGRVVGINTHRLEHGFYLARAVDQALRSAIDAMAEGRTFERVRLGVALAPPHVAARLRAAVGLDERDGLLVRERHRRLTGCRGRDQGGRSAGAGRRPRADGRRTICSRCSPRSWPAVSWRSTVVRGAEELTITVTF